MILDFTLQETEKHFDCEFEEDRSELSMELEEMHIVTKEVGRELLKQLVTDNLLAFEDDTITAIKEYAFYKSTKLQTLRLPKLAAVPVSLCNGASGLETVDLPNATGRMGNSAFQKCTKLKTLNIPNITGFVNYAVAGCTELETLDLSPNFYAFGGGAACNGCTKLVALILRRTSSIVTLGNKNNFVNTPIESGTGYVYAPRDLLSKYQSATNWSTYPTQFRPLEDYTVDGTTTGAFDYTKI